MEGRWAAQRIFMMNQSQKEEVKMQHNETVHGVDDDE